MFTEVNEKGNLRDYIGVLRHDISAIFFSILKTMSELELCRLLNKNNILNFQEQYYYKIFSLKNLPFGLNVSYISRFYRSARNYEWSNLKTGRQNVRYNISDRQTIP